VFFEESRINKAVELKPDILIVLFADKSYISIFDKKKERVIMQIEVNKEFG
jgi:hypothetical protein